MQPNDLKIYIAAPFFKPKELALVKTIETLLFDEGKKIMGAPLSYYSPRSEGILKDMNARDRENRMTYLFEQNVNYLKWCTHVLAVIDDYDTGTVWEMGYAFCAEKEIVTYSANYHGINVMLNESILAHCTELDDIVPSLFGQKRTNKGSNVT